MQGIGSGLHCFIKEMCVVLELQTHNTFVICHVGVQEVPTV